MHQLQRARSSPTESRLRTSPILLAQKSLNNLHLFLLGIASCWGFSCAPCIHPVLCIFNFQGKAVGSTTSTRCGRCHLRTSPILLAQKSLNNLHLFLSGNGLLLDYSGVTGVTGVTRATRVTGGAGEEIAIFPMTPMTLMTLVTLVTLVIFAIPVVPAPPASRPKYNFQLSIFNFQFSIPNFIIIFAG